MTEVPPNPAALIESMRAFGYSLPTAIADLVDNSITAGATLVSVRLHWAGAGSWVAVADDGAGMGSDELTAAMRLGSQSPREVRSPADLGRFGLGLKTAAFSQARSLTVASRRSGTPLAVRRWDLDHVAGTGTWALLLDAPEDAPDVLGDLEDAEHGTIVVLGNLDRLAGSSELTDGRSLEHFLGQADLVERHLGMVFHRFIDRGRLTVTVNGRPVRPWDPFLSGLAHVQPLPRETLTFEGGAVEVRPFVLPHYSKMGADAHREAAGPKGWNLQQGFYVYRAQRLLVAGDWLGLPMSPEEHYKLARICVDLDNTMDDAWQIDVRKATARIPRDLRPEMKRIAEATRRRAAQAYRYRGKRLTGVTDPTRSFVWSARIHDGQIAYRIDRQHPVVRTAIEEAGEGRQAVERALHLVEETVPVNSIVMDAREHPDSARDPFEGREADLRSMLREVYRSLVSHGASPVNALATLSSREPFNLYPEMLAALEEEVA